MKKKDRQHSLLIGRETELGELHACIKGHRNVLLEGPVGAGKTILALKVTEQLGLSVFRVDGDQRYSEQKLCGWFDPPSVIKKGYGRDSFIPGPLIEAMQTGGVLFINELNRLPEGVQNVLLPAIDEGLVIIPRLGTIRAKKGFCVVATQNPKEFVATSHLSEAILDRFELVVLDYQSEVDEVKIVQSRVSGLSQEMAELAVKVMRMTRDHPRVKRGASIRAAIAVGDIAMVFLSQKQTKAQALLGAVLLAFPTRIEIEKDPESQLSLREDLIVLLKEWVCLALDGKKKT